jgi:hypothetical protein
MSAAGSAAGRGCRRTRTRAATHTNTALPSSVPPQERPPPPAPADVARAGIAQSQDEHRRHRRPSGEERDRERHSQGVPGRGGESARLPRGGEGPEHPEEELVGAWLGETHHVREEQNGECAAENRSDGQARQGQVVDRGTEQYAVHRMEQASPRLSARAAPCHVYESSPSVKPVTRALRVHGSRASPEGRHCIHLSHCRAQRTTGIQGHNRRTGRKQKCYRRVT